jgi:putative transposase
VTRDSFTIQEQSFRAEPRAIRVGKIGMIRTKEYVLSDGRPKQRSLVGRVLRIVVSRRADRWYASIMVERDRPDPLPVQGSTIGVDFGINHRVTTSDGEQFAISQTMERRLHQLAHLMRLYERKRKGPVQGTKNRWKMRMRIARIHKEIADRRNDQVHKLSHRLATTSAMIIVEGFNIATLVEKRRKKIRGYNKVRARRKIYEAAWGELRRQLEYKTKWYGSQLVVTDPYAATDRTCHACGHVNDPPEHPTNSFACASCHVTLTRQENTALLQRQQGERLGA